jgi:superfamily II DNA or RNA helicase
MADDDLRYEPPHRGHGWLRSLQPASCLVVGEVRDGDEREAISAVAADVREVLQTPFASMVHRGSYAFMRSGVWHAVVVASGLEPREADSARRRYTEGGHLVIASLLHEQFWNGAQPFAGRARFRPGDIVRPKGGTGGVGRVRGARAVAGSYQYEVDLQGEIKRYNEEALVPVQGDPRSPEFWLTQPPAGAEDFSLTLTWAKLTHPLTDTIYSYASSKTIFRPYQFKPVLKVLTGSSGRLLIADEVGLGKTIEASLIWAELEQRTRLDRVLVVAPAVLTLKWVREMRRRFDLELVRLSTSDLAEFAERLAAGDDPPLRGVVSLESMRRAEDLLERLADLHPRFDLVIVDEAHYLRNRGTKSHTLGLLLADWADYLIFLSATPLNLGNHDLFNLVNLLDEGHFNDPLVFPAQLEPNEVLNDVARSLVDKGRDTPRKLLARLDDLNALQFGSAVTDRPDYALLRRLLDVDRRLTHDEVARARRLLADLNTLAGVLTRTRKVDIPDQKAARVPVNIDVDWTLQERAYYQAVFAWYMRRAQAMNVPPGFATQMPLRQAASCIPASQELIRVRNPELFAQEYDDPDEEGPADLDGLLDIPILATPLSVDTKYEQLLAELMKIRAAGLRQVMIFSFFRRTLAYLARRLSEHFEVRVMHGGVPMEERDAIMREFREGAFDILLLSEVGSEGLDFEFCNVLVNYDLPWNPMRVEQRIGRLDRFGQEHEKIFIYNMRVPGTIETDIFQRLYDRIGVFERSIGELEPILRDELEGITRRLLDPKLDPEERQRETDRIAIALQHKAHDTEKLRESQAILSGLDSLLIEEFTDSGPGNGRFIGQAEIQRLLDRLFRRYGGQRGRPNAQGIFHIVGSERLAGRLRRSRVTEGGSRHTPWKLAALLQNKTPVECTFHPETASKYDVELLSARHPLIKLALEVLADEALDLPRFGSVAVPGLPANRRYLVTIDLAETSGLRPLLELWATAVDLDSGELNSEVGDHLLTALAEGTLQDGPPAAPPNLHDVLQLAQDYASIRQRETERIRAQENEALVEGRIRAQESSFDIKINSAEDVLQRLRNERRSAQVIRMQEGRLRNLRARRAAAREELLKYKELSISLTAIAVLLATAAEPTPSRGTTASGRKGLGRVRS